MIWCIDKFIDNFIFFKLANDVVGTTVKEIGKQFEHVFMVEDTKKEILAKLAHLEDRLNSKY